MAENNPKQVSRMLRRMDDGQQAAFLSDDLDEAARADLYKAWKNGDNVRASDVAEASSADPQTVRLIADGSGDVDDAYDRAVIQAANSDSVASNKQLKRVVRKVDDLDGTRQRRAKQLIAETDGAGVKLVDELDDNALNNLLDYDGESARGMRKRITELYDNGDIRKNQIETFGRDLESLREADVDGVEHVISEDIVTNGEAGNVEGAMYEFRVANERVDNLNNIDEIGREIDTVDYSDLSDDQIDQLIKEIHFPDADTRAAKERIIKDAVSPDPDGTPKTMEVDVLKKNGDYVEAKAKDRISWTDIRSKTIRYKANQLNGNIEPNDGIMKVVGRPSRFSDGRPGGPDLNKVGRVIQNTRGLEKATLQKYPN
ncbi:hypothetical protein [Haloarcula sp. CGMCC 1.2071]|uniref:hypothetical protein n=1 Tax=Haloarcula sp. CGMCC 1.2071 TaxID=3111454 RepID=UPI00300F1F58